MPDRDKLPRFDAATLPPPLQWEGRSIWRTDLKVIQTSTGTSWELLGPVSGVGNLSTDNTLSAATANRQALQAALDTAETTGARLDINQTGTYYIDQTLTIGSNVQVRFAPGFEIKAFGAGVGNLMTTKAYAQAGTAVTVAWSSGLTATVTWTGHGLTTSDFVWLNRADQAQFCGSFGRCCGQVRSGHKRQPRCWVADCGRALGQLSIWYR
jgi:hypothetical protein